jgi:hypothetical protein
MRLAKHEPEINQWRAAKTEPGSFLTINEVLRKIDLLRDKKKPKRKG